MLRSFASFMFFATLVLVFTSSTVNAETISIDMGTDSKSSHDNDNKDNGDVVGLIDPLLRLNRFNFNSTILEPHSYEIPHWVVFFCPPWFEPCNFAEPVFRGMAQHWEEKLNTGLLSKTVRFAAVDCATEKALCNTQNVFSYPFIAHYHEREQVSEWWGQSYETDTQRFKDWLQKELGAGGRKSVTKEQKIEDFLQQIVLPPWLRWVMHVLLVLAFVAGNTWLIRSLGAPATSPKAAAGNSLAASASSSMPAASPMNLMKSSTVARCVPKEWGSQRLPLEL